MLYICRSIKYRLQNNRQRMERNVRQSNNPTVLFLQLYKRISSLSVYVSLSLSIAVSQSTAHSLCTVIGGTTAMPITICAKTITIISSREKWDKQNSKCKTQIVHSWKTRFSNQKRLFVWHSPFIRATHVNAIRCMAFDSITVWMH